MKPKLNITPGEWEYVAGGELVARRNGHPVPCVHDDYRLCADAGNTYHACGLTPSELLEQRGVMLETLRWIAKHTDPDSPDENYRADDREGLLDTAHDLACRAIAAAEQGE